MSIMERVSPKTQISPNRMDLYDIKSILEAPPYNQLSHPDAESSGNIIKLRFSEKGIYEGLKANIVNYTKIIEFTDNVISVFEVVSNNSKFPSASFPYIL